MSGKEEDGKEEEEEEGADLVESQGSNERKRRQAEWRSERKERKRREANGRRERRGRKGRKGKRGAIKHERRWIKGIIKRGGGPVHEGRRSPRPRPRFPRTRKRGDRAGRGGSELRGVENGVGWRG